MTQHQCDGQSELRAQRLLLALLTDDESASASMSVIDAELEWCGRCWRAVAHWLAGLVAGDYGLRAGSTTAACDAVAAGIERTLMPPDDN